MPQTEPSPLPDILPVAEDEIMVLVAKFEPLSTNEKEVARFIVEDLQETFERSIPFSNIRIRKYPLIITTNSDAVAVAEAVDAPIVVWGNHNEELINVKIQVGDLERFSTLSFDRQSLERMINTQVQIEQVTEESIAVLLVNTLIFLEIAGNESPARSTAMLTMINDRFIDPKGNNAAARMQRFSHYMFADDYESALHEIETAITFDSGNPLLYELRGGLYVRIEEYEQGIDDLTTAMESKPDGWVSPNEILGFVSLFQGEPEQAIDYFTTMTAMIPDQWRSHYYVGLGNYFNRDYQVARQNMEQAIALNPDVNWPYIFAIQIALREGRLNEAIALSHLVQTKFPDPTYGNLVMESSLGNSSLVGAVIAGYGYGLLAQYEEVIAEMDRAIAINNQLPELYWMRGFAYCNLQQFEAAEADYSAAIGRDSTYMLPYLSRAEVRLRLGDSDGAQADIDLIMQSEQVESFAQMIALVESGTLNCKTLLSFE